MLAWRFWHDSHNIVFKIELKFYIASGSAPPPSLPKKVLGVPLSSNIPCEKDGYLKLMLWSHFLHHDSVLLFPIASTPLYAPLNANNSATLPACFVLRLNNPMPLCLALVRRIQQVTEMECGDLSTPHPLLSLVTQHASDGQLDCANNRGLFVVCFCCALFSVEMVLTQMCNMEA